MALNHVNVRTTDLERMKDFLEEVGEVKAGPRPDFGFPGYWLYCGDQAIFHLMIAKDQSDCVAGSVDHVALDGFHLETKTKSLEDAGHKFRTTGVPGTGMMQIFVDGPDGVCLELQCRG